MPESFKEYVYYLLTAPYKAVNRAKNCWWALAYIIGAHFDELKDRLLWVREQAYLATCDPLLLPYYGEDRDMPRLKGESTEGYRRRLAMKYELAEKAGTNDGILAAVRALGYANSHIEPLYQESPDQWAEFRVWLETDNRNKVRVNDFEVINSEVMEVKPASAMPTYGVGFSTSLDIQTEFILGTLTQPYCGTFGCGKYPLPHKVSHEAFKQPNCGNIRSGAYPTRRYMI